MLTKWEYKELQSLRRKAKSRIQKEIEELYIPQHGHQFSRAEMGSTQLKTLESQIKNLERLEKERGYEFNRIKSRLKNWGRDDYEMRKAIVYRENFLNSLENLALNNDEFQKIYDYFKSITNPLQFYETAQRSELLQDFFLWYQQPESYLQFNDTNELADYILSQYKLEK